MASFFFIDTKEIQHRHMAPARPKLVQNFHSTDDDSSLSGVPSSLRRTEVCPPSLFSRSGPQWKRWVTSFWAWLWDLDESVEATPVLTGLTKVKSEFCAALWDLQSIQANRVRDSIAHARSLRELWHLRSDVFSTVSAHRGQSEANARIEALNGHFPVRISRQTAQPRPARTTTW